MSETAIRREMVTAWAPYIAIIVTIVVTVGGAAWSIRVYSNTEVSLNEGDFRAGGGVGIWLRRR